MRHNVSVGLDGSPGSLAAAEWAAREAEGGGGSVFLMHAQPRRLGRRTLTTPTDPLPRPTGRHWTPFPTAERLRKAHPGVPVEADEFAARPVDALLDAARNAELLVLGACGAGGLKELVLGSVALEVAASAPLPVVLIPSGYEAADGGRRDREGRAATAVDYRDVVLGLELESPSDQVIEFAFDAASRRAVALRIVHGGTAPEDGGAGAAPPENRGSAVDRLLAPWRKRYPRTDVTTETMVGPPEQHLLDAASDSHLLVLGRRGNGLGPLAHAVLRHADVPVAIVPHT